MTRFFTRKSAPALRLVPAPEVRTLTLGEEHTETVHVADRASKLRITCRSGHLHAHWQCDCGATGISSPYASVESAVEAAHAAVHRHHSHRHTPSRALAIA